MHSEKYMVESHNKKFLGEKELVKDGKSTYYGEVSLTVVLKSFLEDCEFKEAYHEDGLRATITIEAPNGETIKADTLEIESAKWTNFDDL